MDIGNRVSACYRTNNQDAGISIIPSFDNPESLLRPSPLAQAQLFQAIKFQCRTCGLRLDSGDAYRTHLDQHFGLASGQAGYHQITNQPASSMTNNELMMANGSNGLNSGGSGGAGQSSLATITSNASNKRPKYQSFNEFIRTKQSSRRDSDVVPFEGNTLCHVCSEQMDVTLDENDEVVLAWCKKVAIPTSTTAVQQSSDSIVETKEELATAQQNKSETTTVAATQKVVIIHSHCFEALSKMNQQEEQPIDDVKDSLKEVQKVSVAISKADGQVAGVRSSTAASWSQQNIDKLKSIVQGSATASDKRKQQSQNTHSEEVKESEQKRIKK